ncbi:FlgD immunoglobulin-like domain containing protein [Deinococcus deserti]|uniref:Uncharacterized protein n=1 Tax=Deinococcus deserti (strain DSM 17065 / CIP 109153 / LMG 22923 / VCD115) TaxID=546414 RepID=C1D0J3_DEIDV|nr:FlgD immunoglobulin-like domain containing protein [Deinococcus deserti]ACO45367.1 conserved hypothetical protein, precursor [Deinococcus deserti VCD115]
MTKRLFLTAALLGAGLGSAQTNIPALPPGTTAPATTDRLFVSGYRLSQLQAVEPLLQGLTTLQGSRIDEQQGRVVVSGLNAVDRLELLRRLRIAGLPAGVVTFTTSASGSAPGGGSTGTVTQPPTTQTPTAPASPATPPVATPARPSVSTLPARARPLSLPHRAVLTGPASVTAGQPNTWSFNLTNTGTQAINLQHGACDVRFEVLNAAGEIVRPDPKDTVCTMQLVLTNVAPGQTREVQKIRWEGKNAQGQPVPAGTYTIRAVFDGPVLIRAQELKVTVR